MSGFSLAYTYYFFLDDFGDPAYLAAFLSQARARGFGLYAWDVNGVMGPREFDRAIGWGLDGVIVDDVGALTAHLPEPASAPLLGLALLALAWACRPRRPGAVGSARAPDPRREGELPPGARRRGRRLGRGIRGSPPGANGRGCA